METQQPFIQWAVDKFEAMRQSKEPAADGDQAMDTVEVGGKSDASAGGEGQSQAAADAEAAELKEKKRLAAERQAKIMAQMKKAQASFMSVHAKDFAGDQELEAEEAAAAGEDRMDVDDEECQSASRACLGVNRRLQLEEDLRETCILCSEAAVVNGSASAQHLVYSCYVQKSNVVYGPREGASASPLTTSDYPHVSSCGHVMHASCWKEYYKNERAKENRRPHRHRSPGSFDIDKKEFLCPLCRCLSNTVMPLNQSLGKIYAANGGPRERVAVAMDFGAWLEVMRSGEVFQGEPGQRQCLLEGDEKRAAFHALCPPVSKSALLPQPMRELIELFAEPLLSCELGATFQHHLYRACMYTVQAVEMVLRATNKPLRGHLSIRQSNCLSGLVRVCGLVGSSNSGSSGSNGLMHAWSDQFSLYTTGDNVLRVNVFERLLVTLFLVPAVMYEQGREKTTKSEGAEGEMITTTTSTDASVEGEEASEMDAVVEEVKETVESSSSSSSSSSDLCGMATGQTMDYYNLRLAFVLNMIKIIITYDPQSSDTTHTRADPMPETDVDMMTSSTIVPELPNLLTYYHNHNIYTGRSVAHRVTSRDLVEEVQRKSETFLRSACLLFHFLTGVDMPEEFECVGGDTFELMCEYLGLSAQLETYFQCEQTLQFVTARAMNQEIIDLRKAVQKVAQGEREKKEEENEEVDQETVAASARVVESVARIEPCWLPVRRLVELPEDYSDLINGVSLFTCPNSNLDDSRNPTMCLVCGAVLCSQTYCCRFETARSTVGACTFHAMSCNNEVAPFLRIRECEVMLLGINKGCFMLPPYLDEYGETDQGMRRGNPMTLCRERYQRLHLMWISHSLHEEISRAIETANSIGSTQWQYL